MLPLSGNSQNCLPLRPGNFGYSLVELTIVMALIFTMAALAMAFFQQSLGKAEKMDSVAKMKNLSLALYSYAQDHQNKYPNLYNGEDAGASQYPEASWDICLIPYISDITNAMHVRRDNKIVRSKGDPRSFTLSAAVVNIKITPDMSWDGYGLTQPPNMGISVASISKPSTFAILYEAFNSLNSIGAFATSVMSAPYGDDPDPKNNLQNTGFYFLLADGHVEWSPPPFDPGSFWEAHYHAN